MFLQELPGNLRRSHGNDVDIAEFDACNLSVEFFHQAMYPPECRLFHDQFRQVPNQWPRSWAWRGQYYCRHLLGDFEFVEDEERENERVKEEEDHGWEMKMK